MEGNGGEGRGREGEGNLLQGVRGDRRPWLFVVNKLLESDKMRSGTDLPGRIAIGQF